MAQSAFVGSVGSRRSAGFTTSASPFRSRSGVRAASPQRSGHRCPGGTSWFTATCPSPAGGPGHAAGSGEPLRGSSLRSKGKCLRVHRPLTSDLRPQRRRREIFVAPPSKTDSPAPSGAASSTPGHSAARKSPLHPPPQIAWNEKTPFSLPTCVNG